MSCSMVSSLNRELEHRPGSGKGRKFSKCEGVYEGPQFSGVLKFMRVWLKKGGRWRIIAGATLK